MKQRFLFSFFRVFFVLRVTFTTSFMLALSQETQAVVSEIFNLTSQYLADLLMNLKLPYQNCTVEQ